MDKINQLLQLNVNDYTQKKGKLTYLSWSFAWREFLKVYPEATYKIRRKENGETWFGNDKIGYMVYTEVTAGGITHEMFLPVMDYRNKSMLEPTTFDINKAIMRCLTKNLAIFGLGLYIYAGEDLPEETHEPLPQNKIKALYAKANEKGYTNDSVKSTIKKHYNADSTKDLTVEQFTEFMDKLEKAPPKEGK